MRLAFLIIGLCFLDGFDGKRSYEGYKVYRLTPKTEDQLKFLIRLEYRANSLNFWSGVKNIGSPVDVMVPPNLQNKFVSVVQKRNISISEFISNVQSQLQKEVVFRSSGSNMNWKTYAVLDVIYTWMENLAKENPAVTIVNGGISSEGRTIKGARLSYSKGNRAVMLEGGIHAREWISTATVTFILDTLIRSEDPTIRKIANSFDWYIFPVCNPDGYEYTHTTDRLWRKTRTNYGRCRGADPNRNWDVHWREQGTNDSVCSNSYAGPRAFSEIETLSLSKFIRSIGPNLVAYISFHSYSQVLLIPYGHTTAHLDNYDTTLSIGQKAIKALSHRYGTKYDVGNVGEIMYLASGGSMDWVKQEFHTPIVYTYELRDKGQDGFVLPENQIIPTCLETMDSVTTIFLQGEKYGLFTLK